MLSWRLARLSLQKSFGFSNIKHQNVLRAISTSEKNREATTATVTGTADPCAPKVKSTWQSYGFGITEQSDYVNMHLSFFFGITLLFVGCGFYVAYAPTEIDWEQREAFLELRKREELGLPLIDPNYIDPSLIDLSFSDENVEIII